MSVPSKTTFRYLNPWSTDPVTKPEYFATATRPVNYRGFQIFRRLPNSFELVKDGVCLTQRAGGAALQSLADALLGDKSNHPVWQVERARSFGAAHGVKFNAGRAA